MKNWKPEQMKSQVGRIALITGGSSGIGYQTALELARKGARVIIASDDIDKGIAAIKTIADEVPDADIGFEALDLSDLESVRLFAFRMKSMISSLDLLILNAGLASIPKRMESEDGLEMTFATNYLGHFTLTGLLFPLLLQVPDSRVITVSSIDHRFAQIHFEDLQFRKKYDATAAYAQSKLALLLFGLELHRRCREKGLFLKSIPVHPGAVRTHIFDRGPERAGSYYNPEALLKRLSLKTIGQSAQRGAIPVLFAASAKEARSGEYYGPDGFQELWGDHPSAAKLAVQATNLTAARRLWEISEKLSGINFDFGGIGLSHHH